jgi:hypothetical protein
MDDRKLMVAELKMVCPERNVMCSHTYEPVNQVDMVAAIWVHVETLAAQEQPSRLSDTVKTKYLEVFDPILDIEDLPMDVYCLIKLKDASKTFTTCMYSSPCKYKEAWATLIEQHLDAGCICPSNSAHASPAFLAHKSDTTVLP